MTTLSCKKRIKNSKRSSYRSPRSPKYWRKESIFKIVKLAKMSRNANISTNSSQRIRRWLLKTTPWRHNCTLYLKSRSVTHTCKEIYVHPLVLEEAIISEVVQVSVEMVDLLYEICSCIINEYQNDNDNVKCFKLFIVKKNNI